MNKTQKPTNVASVSFDINAVSVGMESLRKYLADQVPAGTTLRLVEVPIMDSSVFGYQVGIAATLDSDTAAIPVDLIWVKFQGYDPESAWPAVVHIPPLTVTEVVYTANDALRVLTNSLHGLVLAVRPKTAADDQPTVRHRPVIKPIFQQERLSRQRDSRDNAPDDVNGPVPEADYLGGSAVWPKRK